MPRLGDDNSSGEGRNGRDSGGPTRSPFSGAIAQAYPNGDRKNAIVRMTFTFVLIVFLRNVFFTDYRSNEINTLRSSGMTEEQIAKIVPPTILEQKQLKEKGLNEFMQLKVDVATLKEEVDLLKSKMNGEKKEDSETIALNEIGKETETK